MAAKPRKVCRRLAGPIAERCFYRRRLMPNGWLDNPDREFRLAFGLRALMPNTIDMAAKFLEDRALSRLLPPLGVAAIMRSGTT